MLSLNVNKSCNHYKFWGSRLLLVTCSIFGRY